MRYSPECSFVFGTAWWPRSIVQELTRRWRSLQSRHWFPRGSRAGSLPRWSERVENDRRSINLEERRRGRFHGNTHSQLTLSKPINDVLWGAATLSVIRASASVIQETGSLKCLFLKPARNKSAEIMTTASFTHAYKQGRIILWGSGFQKTHLFSPTSVSKNENEALFILHIQ